ncbi:MAG: type I-D CRISPR-associated helicase Cas3', partial [Phototrophicales bacterium]
MIRFTLEGQTEKLAPHGTFPDTLTRRPLYHQVQTWDAWKTHTAVLNTYNTGVGKTIASLLPLLDIDAENRPNKQRNVLFIAPTNALIAQHTDDIKDFVREHNLNFHVFSARADDIKRVRGGLRPGETLQRYITNYPEFERTEQERRSIVMVTNPDIFYYALYFQYGAHDRRNVFKAFLMRFDYLIIDEFHYYDNKQLAAFLFAFLIFKEWGYFDAGRRVCLLSATPRPNVRRYLEGLFGEQLAEVSPQNEPETTAEYDTLPALTPLEVTVITDTLEDWLENTGADTLRQWLDDDLDGAIISNSLGRINRAYARLKNRVDSIEMGRITGPEPQEQRSQATARKLILATPTVDIGYNFAKHNKSRQNIDFVVCEARFQDDLVQRIGRAGRVLGKDIIDKTSQAIVLLPDDAAHEFRALDGQTLNRRDFAEWLNNREHLTSKHALEAYIRKYAALELAYPLYQLEFMLAGDDRHELDTIYERACELFGVAYPQARWGLKKQFQRQERRMAWLREAESANKHTPPSKTAEHLADYLAFAHPEVGRVEPNDLSP